MVQAAAGPDAHVRPRGSFAAAYLATYATGELARKASRAVELLESCRLCPRDCGVDRMRNEIGICRTGRLAEVASAFPDFGEEECLSGWGGSGTIFFAWCNLECSLCRTTSARWEGEGHGSSAEQIAARMLDLQGRGCHNIHLVTPEHVVPQILEALLVAVPLGLTVPLVYGTSAYDSMQSLELLEGVIDIYLPDFKFWDSATADWLVGAEDYPRRARRAIRAMHRQVGDLVLDEHGLALRGLLVRHLVMPNAAAGTRQIMRFLSREVSPDTFVSLLGRDRASGPATGRPSRLAGDERGLSDEEHAQALAIGRDAGLRRFDQSWRGRFSIASA